MQEVISSFADILALLYHEGRNVRHLSRNEKMNVDPRFLSLRDGLATNRYQAWEQIQPLRGKAVLSPSARLAERVFEQKFHLTAEDLGVLFGHSGWKGTYYGGNAWQPIARMAIQLSHLIDDKQELEAASLVESILQSCHNTGIVRDKLRNLDACLPEL